MVINAPGVTGGETLRLLENILLLNDTDYLNNLLSPQKRRIHADQIKVRGKCPKDVLTNVGEVSRKGGPGR